MADNRQYMALEWVIRDIKETLLQAQSALDDYACESADVIQLKFCVTYIHQVYGSLHMAGFHGAAMIASEAEALAQNLLEGNIAQPKEATEVLTKAIEQLSDYLDHALKEKCDQPSLVFLLLNDLRAVRGAQFLSESALFSPNLDYAHTVHGTRHQILDDEQQLIVMLKKLREMYQYAAASVMHKTNVAENLGYLAKVSQRLEKILQGTLRVALWEVVSAFLSAVDESVIAESVSIKKLFRQLDEELQQLVDEGVSALNQKTSDEFLKNWLYYLSSLKNTNDAISCVVERYALKNASVLVHENNKSIKPIDSSAMRAVAQAIVDEFSEVKTILANCHASGQLSTDLSFIRSVFQRAADTLAILSVNTLRQEMLVNIARIDQLKSYQGDDFPTSQLNVIETSIAEIEGELESSLLDSQSVNGANDRSFDAAQEEALQESRNGLEEAKDSVVNYIATQWNIKNLQPVPEILQGVVTHLTTLSFQVPAEILDACANYIETRLINQPVKPKWEQLDSLADVIASVDYFLEVFLLTKEEDHAILHGAEQGLLDLGVSYSGAKPSAMTASEHVTDGMVELNESDVDALLDNADSHGSSVSGNNDDGIDAEAAAEIIEIFTEEAEEVQATIAEYLPIWADGFSDENALVELRRAFHTLKGSGRLVKASDIGELSWSIENLLNRVLDKTLKPEKIQIDIIKKALELLPPMVEAFSQQKATPNALLCEQCRLWAHELAQGEASPELQGALNEADTDKQVVAPEYVADDQDDDIDVQLWEIFGAESETHLAVVREYIAQMDAARPFFEVPSDAMQRAMHTIKGSAHMAEITPIAQLMTPMELFVKDLRAYQVVIDDDILQLIKDSVTYTEDALEQISRLMFPVIEKLDLFLARVAELRDRSVGHLISHEDENAGPKVDPAFLEMLMNEGMNLLLDIDPIMNAWRASPATANDWQPIADELAKVQHGAERANLGSMVVVSQTLHQQYEHLIHGRIQATDHIYDVMLDAHYALLDIIDAIAGGQDLPDADAQLMAQLNAFLVAEEAPESSHADGLADETAERDADEKIDSVNEEVLLVEPSQDDTLELDSSTVDIAENESPADVSLVAHQHFTPVFDTNDDLDEEVVGIFMEEAAELIEEMDDILQDIEEGSEGREINEGMQRVLHTFKGGARLAGLTVLGDLAHDFESYLITHYYETVSATLIDDIHQYQDRLIAQLDALNQSDVSTVDMPNDDVPDVVSTAPVIETVQATQHVDNVSVTDSEQLETSSSALPSMAAESDTEAEQTSEPAASIIDEPNAESTISTIELIDNIASELMQLEAHTDACHIHDNVLRLISDVKASANTAGMPLLHQAAQQFESYIFTHYYETVSPELMADLHQYKEQLSQLVTSDNDVVASAQSSSDDINTTSQPVTNSAEASEALATQQTVLSPSLDEAPYSTLPTSELEDASESNADDNTLELDTQKEDEQEHHDLEIAEPQFSLQAFIQSTPTQKQSDTSEDSETVQNNDLYTLESVAAPIDEEISVADEQNVSSVEPDLSSAELEIVDGGYVAVTDTEFIEVDESVDAEINNDGDDEDEPSSDNDNVVSFLSKPVEEPLEFIPTAPAMPSATDAAQVTDITSGTANSTGNTAAARRAGPQETVKVSSELMEELVNLAGETSISRGRLEEQMSEMNYSISEMDETVARLQEQLRRLDIETEAQVIFRQEQLGEREDFDPLEMDRYSQLQQLSRSLTESASDLQDLKFTLSNKARDTETMLLQQSRINTELQKGLMRSRMVPFSRIVPRLRRIVRQIAAELGKAVEFDFANTEGELDRNMMERMIAPLEHMLRNAVDHGIEDGAVRKQKGKPEAGRISLSLVREGGSVLIYLGDDGAGMDIERIREKAIERKMMTADAALSDNEVVQFIFQAGFSTAETVTQISGRGVGMDVVSSEIKQLGGAVEIHTEENKGTQFMIRLPFTLSVNRALMITIGDDNYAVPLNAIEGIARINPQDLAGYYNDPDSRFKYAGNQYQLQYLGSLLDKSAQPKVEGHDLPVPVLLVRSADHAVALQVDGLQGSREIVVKTLGSQFSAVQGLSGATIMGDGSVVVILDVYAMMRQQFALSNLHVALPDTQETELVERNPLVMVVDDSVTVRKVTTRFLEREGFDVITAKDGVDAITTLRDHQPDLMLLDIEMPRMDGFEVAKRVRTMPRISELPIIMITSRTGEKHRQTGLAAGANEYMGKPFQEGQLLNSIQQLLRVDQ